jgi:catechol 2,3-dioxygenase-like lactoylglutathione lyase family enzyme
MLVGSATVLAVRDVAASTAYYRDGLGFSVEFEWGNPVSYVCLCRDAVALHLAAESGANRQVGQTAICVFVKDVDAVHAEFSRRGVSTIKPPQDYDYGMREFDLLDPDGNRLIFGMATKVQA